MLGIFYSSLPSTLCCRTSPFVSGFGRKVSCCRFVAGSALDCICFLLSLRGRWSPFPGEALALCRLVACPSWWSLAYVWPDLGGHGLPTFLHLCSYTHSLLHMHFTDVWLLGFQVTFWVTYVCSPRAPLSYLLVSCSTATSVAFLVIPGCPLAEQMSLSLPAVFVPQCEVCRTDLTLLLCVW